MKFTSAMLVLLALGVGFQAQAAKMVNGFDSPSALEKLGPPDNLRVCTDKKVAGAGSVAVRCMVDSGHAFLLPKDARQGVLSFWIFDPIFAGESFFRPGVAVFCQTEEGGKVKEATFSLNMEGVNWQFHDSRKLVGGDEHGRNLNVPRHAGWTRLDIVAPAGSGPRQFLLYIDGRPVGKTVEAYTAMTGVKPGAYWGGGTIYLDELAFDSDPAAFKPNVVRNIVLGDEAGRVNLLAGQSLKLGLELAREGASAAEGSIDVRLLDGAEKEVAAKKVHIDWKNQKAEVRGAELPAPPHSGRYWVVATYKDKGTAVPVTAIERCDIQFSLKDRPHGENGSVVLAKAWDWLPFGENSPPGHNTDTPAQAPEVPPEDWSKAIPVKGVWYSYGTMLREFGNQCGWYHRQVQITPDWKGRRIELDIEDVQTIATVYIDRKKVGDVEWPGGCLDITGVAEAGKTIDLAIFVRAEIIAGYNRVMREILGDTFNPTQNIMMRGLRGPVTLRGTPRGAAIDHTAVRTRTSTTPKRIEVEYACVRLEAGRNYTVSGTVSAAGKPILTLPVTTFRAKASTETVKVSADWADPVLWDIYTPFQYDLGVSLSEGGKVVDVSAPERFGFREVSFQGRRVTLNGRTINLFQNGVLYNFLNPGFAGFLRDMHLPSLVGNHLGYAISLGSGNSGLRDCVEFCTGAGVGVNVWLTPGLTSLLVSFNKENDPRYWDYFQKVSSYVMRKHGNSPGIFFWSGPAGGNTMGMGAMYNPYLQDGLWQRDQSENQQRQRLGKAESRAKAMIKAADPSRQLDAQDSGNFNDACHITQYAGFTPIQELIEMNSYWCENGTKPIFYSEHGAPFSVNWFSHPRDGGHGCRKIIPYFAEWCAVTKGDNAFVRTPLDNEVVERYEKHSKDRFAQIYKIEDKARRAQALADYSNGTYPPGPWGLYDESKNARNQLWLERVREEYLNLRADGIGLLCPWTGGISLRDYSQWFAPVLAFLAGAPGDRYDRTHIYAPGETLKRGVTLVSNDARPRALRCEWTLVLGGKTAASKSQRVELPAGGTLSLPVMVPIKADTDCAGSLTMALFDRDSGARLCDDQLAIDVLCPRPFVNERKIALIDPEGDSALALNRAGVKFKRVPFTMDLAPYEVVIFGRRAFLYELANTPEGFDLEALTQAGKKVIILEQSEPTLRERFKFRTEYISPRNAYGREFRGGLLEGLPDRCLNFWRGTATLTEGYEIARAQLSPRPKEMNGGRWFYVWNDGKEHTRPMKWGNRHNVATVVVVKPDTGNFRPLVDCEFGLNYAAAWQLDCGAGQVVFSQIDISGRTATGPEAERYLQNLVKYTGGLPALSWRKAVYLGGDDGARLLKSLFVPFKRLSGPTGVVPVEHVLILGEAAPAELKAWGAGLAAFVTSGGVVFSLPKSRAELTAGWLPVPVVPSATMLKGVVIGRSGDPMLAGLGNSDFFWRGDIEIVLPGPLPGADLEFGGGVLTRLPQGKGSWVLCQIAPALFGNEDYFWLKDSRRNTERALRTMLSNLGVAMNTPFLMRRPKAARETLLAVDLAGTWDCARAQGDSPEASPLDKVSGWRGMQIPGDFRKALPELAAPGGALWYRRTFELDAPPSAGSGARLFLGAVKGIDFTLVNGVRVGSTDRVTNPNDLSTATRDYPLPNGLLKQGQNEVAVLCAFNTRDSLSPGDGTLAPPLRLELFKERQEGATLAPIELDGWWRGIAVDGRQDLPAGQDKGWHRIKVPGSYMEQHAHWGSHMGYFWYKRTFTLQDVPPAGADPTLVIGSVDDEDDTYVNGVLVGHIGKDTNPKDYWCAERNYRLPAGLLKTGENTVAVRVNNTFLDGGIAGSARVVFEDPKVAVERKLSTIPYLHEVNNTDDPYMYCGW